MRNVLLFKVSGYVLLTSFIQLLTNIDRLHSRSNQVEFRFSEFTFIFFKSSYFEIRLWNTHSGGKIERQHRK